MDLNIKGTVIVKHINYPACEKCDKSAEILSEHGIKYGTIIADKSMFGEIMKITNSQNVPQIILNGEYIGGYEELSSQLS
jgi:glutaredoxin